MKNNFYKYLLLVLFCFFSKNSYGKEFYINALQVDVDKEKEIIYAKGNVEIKDQLDNVIFSEQAEYDKLNTQLESIILIKEICRIHDKCPHHKQIPLHNHYSMMYHFNTLDNSIAEDILVFMRNNIK